MNWFHCTTHGQSHQGTHCVKGTRDTCTDVGPFSTKEQADDWNTPEGPADPRWFPEGRQPVTSPVSSGVIGPAAEPEGVESTAIHHRQCCWCGAIAGWKSWREIYRLGWRQLITKLSKYTMCPKCVR